jgi:hypothetical protein
MRSWEGFGSGRKRVADNDWLARSLVTTKKRREKDEHSGNHQTALRIPFRHRIEMARECYFQRRPATAVPSTKEIKMDSPFELGFYEKEST